MCFLIPIFVARVQIKDLMQDLSSKHIIPNMEQKIRILNQQVLCLALSEFMV